MRRHAGTGIETQRSVVDFGLARRATLESLRGGGPTYREDVCDAHPYLLRAARHHGEPTAADCPVCRRERLVHVSYVYGDELGRYTGRVKCAAELAEMAREHTEFRVYVVEVCTGCAWNHLVQTYLLGTGCPGDEPGRTGGDGRTSGDTRGDAAREVARR